MDHEVDELESAQLSFIIACRLVPRVLPGYPGERPTEVKRRFVDVWIGSSEFVFRRAIGSFQFFHHTGHLVILLLRRSASFSFPLLWASTALFRASSHFASIGNIVNVNRGGIHALFKRYSGLSQLSYQNFCISNRMQIESDYTSLSFCRYRDSAMKK